MKKGRFSQKELSAEDRRQVYAQHLQLQCGYPEGVEPKTQIVHTWNSLFPEDRVSEDLNGKDYREFLDCKVRRYLSQRTPWASNLCLESEQMTMACMLLLEFQKQKRTDGFPTLADDRPLTESRVWELLKQLEQSREVRSDQSGKGHDFVKQEMPDLSEDEKGILRKANEKIAERNVLIRKLRITHQTENNWAELRDIVNLHSEFKQLGLRPVSNEVCRHVCGRQRRRRRK